MTSGKLENQIEHVEKALESVKKRLEVLNELLPNAPESKPTAPEADAKGKGKGKATTVQENPLGWTPKVETLENMTKSEIEAEIKDITSLSSELEMKVRFPVVERKSAKESSFILLSWKTFVQHPPKEPVERQWIALHVSLTTS